MISSLLACIKPPLRTWLIGGLVLWFTIAAGTSIAVAHSGLVETFPSNGAVLDKPPETVTATFSEEVVADGSSLAIFDQNGQQLDVGDGGVDLDDIDHKRMKVSLPPSLADGVYTVHWTAVSAEDDDLTQGEFGFTVGAGVALAETSPSDTKSNSSPLLPLAGLSGVVIVAAAAIVIARRRGLREEI